MNNSLRIFTSYRRRRSSSKKKGTHTHNWWLREHKKLVITHTRLLLLQPTAGNYRQEMVSPFFYLLKWWWWCSPTWSSSLSLSHSIEKRVYLTILRLLISLLKQKGKIKTQEEEVEEAGTGSNLIPFDYYQGAIITALLGSEFFGFSFYRMNIFLLRDDQNWWQRKQKI